MKLFNTPIGPVIEHEAAYFKVPDTNWDALLNRADLWAYLTGIGETTNSTDSAPAEVLAPLGSQEVWAAGVTYYRSRTARMEESKDAGGGTFYDRVYEAERPELFFKSMPHRAVGPRQPVRIRRDSRWNVPEPELALVINRDGKIVGYTIGNDMSSRDIEGENPLYLPQAKVYDGACSLGPCILIAEEPLPPATAIELLIERSGHTVFRGETTLAQMKRTPEELVGYLYRETTFPSGAILLTGTGIVPPDDFSLLAGDHIEISIEGIGTLSNSVAPYSSFQE